MNKPRQFQPLLKLMLGFYRYGPLPLLLWLAVMTGVLFFTTAFILPMSEEQAGKSLLHGQIGAIGLLWFFLILVSTPLPFHLLTGYTSLEFLFTRAIDRGFWLRTERVSVLIIALGPLLLNLALSPWQQELKIEPADSGSPTAAAQERYIHAFPGSHRTAGHAGETEQLVIRHGTEMLAAWMVWTGAATIFLVAGYFTVVFKAWQRGGWHCSSSKWRPWLGAIMVNAPPYLPVLILAVCALCGLNLFEESFLLFTAHPVLMVTGLLALGVAIQALCERNIRKLEFEFF